MKTIHKILIHIFVFTILLLPVAVFAQPNTTPGGTQTNGSTQIGINIQNPFSCGGGRTDCTLLDFVYAILNNIVMPIAAVFVVMWIIYAGFQFVTAQGNEKKVTDAKNNLLWSLVGAGILLGATAIAQVVEKTIELLKA